MFLSNFLSVLADSWEGQKSFDCPMRALALEYARKVEPSLISTQKLLSLRRWRMHSTAPEKLKIAVFKNFSGASSYVDATSGSDSNSGTIGLSFQNH